MWLVMGSGTLRWICAASCQEASAMQTNHLLLYCIFPEGRSSAPWGNTWWQAIGLQCCKFLAGFTDVWPIGGGGGSNISLLYSHNSVSPWGMKSSTRLVSPKQLSQKHISQLKNMFRWQFKIFPQLCPGSYGHQKQLQGFCTLSKSFKRFVG